MSSMRLLLAIVTTYDLEVDQIDVVLAFLHNELKEEIFMRLLLAIVTTYDLEVDQIDVVLAFLHNELKEEIFMKRHKD
jgi:hypothetical protein